MNWERHIAAIEWQKKNREKATERRKKWVWFGSIWWDFNDNVEAKCERKKIKNHWEPGLYVSSSLLYFYFLFFLLVVSRAFNITARPKRNMNWTVNKLMAVWRWLKGNVIHYAYSNYSIGPSLDLDPIPIDVTRSHLCSAPSNWWCSLKF